jgi:hypothetical protein
MKFDYKNLIGIAVVLLSAGMNAQFYVGVQSGTANIQSDVNGVSNSHEIGGALKAGYIYSLTDHIGIGSGVEFSQYKQKVFLNQGATTLTNFEVDATGSAFSYSVTTGDYKEYQTLQAIQIPLFLQYKTNINKGIDFNFRAGVKYFLPVNYKFDASASSVQGTAYYPDVNLYVDDLPEYGFGNQTNYAASGEYNTKGILMSTFELGFTFQMGAKNALYTAMFLDTGYGTILDQEQNESYVGYNPTSATDRKANGLYSIDKNATIKPVSFGLTLGWNFK